MNSKSKMTVWMRFGQPLEDVIEDYGRIFDAWQAGGVEAVVVGRLLFANSSGEPMSISAFDPDPAIYKDLGVEPPVAPKEKLAEKRHQLTKALSLPSRLPLGIRRISFLSETIPSKNPRTRHEILKHRLPTLLVH